MRQTDLKAAILAELEKRSDLPPGLWLRVCRRMSRDIPLSTYYEALYRLRDDGLVTYSQGDLTDQTLDRLIAATKRRSGLPANDGRGGEVAITTKGRGVANLMALRFLAPSTKRREADKAMNAVLSVLAS
jgi:hypothetical protein